MLRSVLRGVSRSGLRPSWTCKLAPAPLRSFSSRSEDDAFEKELNDVLYSKKSLFGQTSNLRDTPADQQTQQGNAEAESSELDTERLDFFLNSKLGDDTNEFSDFLDKDNPPVLTGEHYALLARSAQTIEDTDINLQDMQALRDRVAAIIAQFKRQHGLSPADKQKVKELEEMLEPQEPAATLREAAANAHNNADVVDGGYQIKYHFELDDINYHWPDREQEEDRGDIAKRPCLFCLRDTTQDNLLRLHYTNVQLLHRFINVRGKIMNRRYTSVCAKHQRKLAQCVKQARFIGLLSFVNEYITDFNALAAQRRMVERTKRKPIDFLNPGSFLPDELPEENEAAEAAQAAAAQDTEESTEFSVDDGRWSDDETTPYTKKTSSQTQQKNANANANANAKQE